MVPLDQPARAYAVLDRARAKRRRASLEHGIVRTLVADLVAARMATGMTQAQVAICMCIDRSAISRLESGRHPRLTLDAIEQYARAVGARVELRVRSRWR